MIVQSIRLENWKKFVDPVEIELKEGLNVLYGLNESGKTTILDSIITTFYSKHTSGSQKIKSIKPWGTSLQPRASITFWKNGQEYRINKSFQERKSVLERMNPDGWQRIAEGDHADQELIELVGGQLSSRETKPELWGLGQTLWMIQGEPFISDDLNDETLSSLQTMVGATIESDKEKKVLTEIKTRFLDNFTAKKKELKKGCNLSQVQAEINSLKNQLNQSEKSKNRKDEVIREINDNEFILEKNQKSPDEATVERAKIAKEVEDAHKHQTDRINLEHEIQRIESQYSILNGKINEINQNKEEIGNIKSEIKEVKLKIDPLEENLTEINQNTENKPAELENLNKRINEFISEKNLAGIAHTTIMDEQGLETLKERFEEISHLHEDLQSAQEEYNTLIAPSSSELEKIENLNREIRDIQASLQAIGLRVKATAQPQMSGEIYLDDEKIIFSLKDNESISWRSSQSLRIKIDDVGEFEVSSGSQDVKELKEEMENRQLGYQDLVAPFGIGDLSDLKKANIRKDSSKREIERIQVELKKKSSKSKDELQQEIITLENKIKSNWEKIPDSSQYKKFDDKNKSTVREKLSGKLNQLQTEIDDKIQFRNDLNNEIEADRTLAQDMANTINDYKTDCFGKTQSIEVMEKRLKQLEEDGLSSEERESNLNKLSYELEQKTRAWNVYLKEVEEKEKQPLNAFQGLSGKVERLEKDKRIHEISQAKMESELQMLISQSTDTNVIEERIAQLQINEKELENEANAIKLLFELTSFCRENTIGELSQPIRQKVTQDLEKLIGPKYSLNFNNGMKPESISVLGEDASIDLLSFGTKEQIWCLFRLALGSILSKDNPQLVVLDDPLVNTDPVRMHHALEILEENSKNMQIIVLTCDVDKYNSLIDANFISIS